MLNSLKIENIFIDCLFDENEGGLFKIDEVNLHVLQWNN